MKKRKILPTLTAWRLWLAVLLTLIAAGTILPAKAAAQGEANARLTIVAPALNVRSGPGLTYPAFDVLPQGEQVTVSGYDAAADWWQIQLTDGTTGWVSGGPAYVSVSDRPVGLSAGTATESSGSLVNPEPVSTVVFQTASGGPIYAINADGNNLRYLTTGLDPVLAPDGRRVTFARWASPQLGTLGSLWIINVDGTGERVLLNNVLQPRTPVWSPDGQQIAITVQHGGRVQAERTCGNLRPPREATDVSVRREGRRVVEYCYTLPPDPRWGLRLVDVATGAFEDLPHDTYSLSPAWDPANAWRLVYDGNNGLVNLDLNLGTRWLLTNDIRDRSPVFSPDGRHIAVSYWQHDHWEIHSLNADGSDRRRLTETPWRVIVQQELKGTAPQSWHNAAPVWSPDGTQLAFLTDRTGQWEIWVMNADGSRPRPLFPAEKLAGITIQYNGVNERVLSWR